MIVKIHYVMEYATSAGTEGIISRTFEKLCAIANMESSVLVGATGPKKKVRLI